MGVPSKFSQVAWLFRRQASEVGGSLDFFFFLKDFSSSVNTFEHFEDCHLHSSAGLCFRIFVSVFSKAGAGKKLASEPIAWCFILLLHEHSA